MADDDKQNISEGANKKKKARIPNDIESPSSETAEKTEAPGPYSITEEDLQRRSTEKYSVSLGYLTFGTNFGWSSPLLFKKQFNSTGLDEDGDFGSFFTWMTSMVPFGAFIGYGVWTTMGYKRGPRKTLLNASLIYLFLLILLSFVKQSRPIVNLKRFVMGFFGIAYITCGQMLLIDTIHHTMIIYMRIVPEIAILVGVFIVQIAGLMRHAGDATWISIAITIAALIFLYVEPESPVHLFKKGEAYAEKSLKWYIGEKNIFDSMRRIRRDYAYRRMNATEDKYMLNSTVVRKSIFIIIGVIIFQVGSGYHLFLFYGTIIWSMGPLVDETWDIVILNTSLIFSRLLMNIAHLKFDWSVRIPLILSCTIVATAQLALASVLFVLSINICVQTDYLRWCCFACCFFVIFGFELGLNHYTKILAYMYLPSQVYHTGMIIIHSAYWFSIFFIIKFHGIWHTSPFPSWILFLMLSIFLYVGVFYIYFFVVEVKNRSLIGIQLDMGGNPIGTRAAIGMRTGAEDI